MIDLTIKDQMTEFLLYTSWNGKVKVNVFLHNENLWLTQKQMWELFWVWVPAISKHIDNIYSERELDKNWTVSKMEIVQKEWDRNVKREVEFYNLDVIIAIWYRVNSSKATQFRIWATNILKEFIIKGFIMDDDRLKNGQHFWKDYFKELLERVRSIRASERRIYLQITDIFAECSIDYDKNSDITKEFYATVQNKFHYAITGKTAAEIIYIEADREKENMWLTSFKNSPEWRVLKSDTIVAKNYLKEDEIKKLERTISAYFDYIENQIEQRREFTMEALSKSVNKFLDFNDFKVLEWKWKISKKLAEKKAFEEYNEFNKIQNIDSDFEKILKMKQ